MTKKDNLIRAKYYQRTGNLQHNQIDLGLTIKIETLIWLFQITARLYDIPSKRTSVN